jgi:hypothetical protein
MTNQIENKNQYNNENNDSIFFIFQELLYKSSILRYSYNIK